MPKYHANKLEEVPDEYLVDLLPLSKRIAVSIGCSNYNLLQVGPCQHHNDSGRLLTEDLKEQWTATSFSVVQTCSSFPFPRHSKA